MTIPRTTAKKLSTDAEYRLINESFAPQVSELSEKGLVQRIRRARAARDKYRSQAERQTREARGRIAPRGKRAAAGNNNTVTKQKLFDETLARFEKQAARMGKETSQKREEAADTGRKAARPAAKQPSVGARSSRATPAVKAGGSTSAATKKAVKATKADKATRVSADTKATKATKASPAAAKKAQAKPASKSSVTKSSAAKKAAPQKSADAAAKAKPAAQAAKSSGGTGKTEKSAQRTPASRAGTITKPVKIPPLKQVLAAVSDVVAARKEDEHSAGPLPPARSSKAPAVTNDGAPSGKRTSTSTAGGNPRGPEFPRNPQERGRLGAAVKRQQARRDSR